MARRDFAGAAEALQAALAAAPSQGELWLALAAAERARGRPEAALDAAEAALRLQPRDFVALLLKGSLLERLGREAAAAPVYGAAILCAPAGAGGSAQFGAALARAHEVNARHSATLHAALRASLEGHDLSGGDARRLATFIDRLSGRRQVYAQAPLGYCYPGLPAIELWDRQLFPWLETLEAAAHNIAAEVLAVGSDDAALRPYMQLPDTGPVDQWAELNRSLRWSALHLIERGERVEANARRCPATMAALAAVTQPRAPGRSPSAIVSVLAPRTRIPPHTGVSNTRLVGHLALSIPPGCGLRVGSERLAWREGEAFVFDDTIEHEAWNDADQPRAVLVFDVRHPLITPEEEAAIGAVMAALDRLAGPPAATQGG